jgi:high-affinity iron transporter
MAASFLLSLREGLEAALIIGIVFGVLRKMEHQALVPAVWAGVVSAVLVSLLAALGLNWIGAEFDGQGEQLFEGTSMLLAAGVLTWMVFWMRKQSKTLRQEIEAGIRRATQNHGQRALFFLAFLAVVREGIELALFLLATRLSTNPLQEWLGVVFGIGTAVLLGWGIFASSRSLSLARFFQVTNVLLALFAAGLVGLGIHEFNELGWIPALIDPVWNLSGWIADDSTVGLILKSLFGYASSPSLSQVIGYLGYYAVLGGMLLARRQPAAERATAEASAIKG